MRYLVIDRSTCQPGLAVFEEGNCVRELSWSGEPSRAPQWMADVRRVLAEGGFAAEAFDGFVCGLGPGSFSGIRACLSALNGLALPGAKPVYGVASSAAVALAQAGGDGLVTVVGDARRDRLWCVTYRVDVAARRVRLADGSPPTHAAGDFALVPASALASAVPESARIVSPDWLRLEPLLCSLFPEARLVAEPVYPNAADLGRLAFSEAAARVIEPMPIYLHPAVAEKSA